MVQGRKFVAKSTTVKLMAIVLAIPTAPLFAAVIGGNQNMAWIGNLPVLSATAYIIVGYVVGLVVWLVVLNIVTWKVP